MAANQAHFSTLLQGCNVLTCVRAGIGAATLIDARL
jgi:hypothetical protein